ILRALGSGRPTGTLVKKQTGGVSEWQEQT
ncbi:unnamed protein product, partial [marine sediment metagenome]